jgi:ASCH domain
VLTIRQPWASAIFVAGKDIENRGWATEYRGRLWIHAGLHKNRKEPDRWAQREGLWIPEEPLPRGVILGSVELLAIVEKAESVWALPGELHWLLRRPRLLLRPVPWTGGLTLKWIRPPQGTTMPARRSRKSYRRQD